MLLEKFFQVNNTDCSLFGYISALFKDSVFELLALILCFVCKII